MFNKIKDSIAERMIEKIIDEKSINIYLSINKRSDREYKDIADVLTDSDIDMKISHWTENTNKADLMERLRWMILMALFI